MIPFFFNLEGILDIYLLLDRNFYVVIPFSLSSLSTLLSLDIMVMGFKDVQLRAQDLMGSARGFILADKSVKKDFIKENKRQMLQFLFFPPPLFSKYTNLASEINYYGMHARTYLFPHLACNSMIKSCSSGVILPLLTSGRR